VPPKINIREKGIHCKDTVRAAIEVVPHSPRWPCPECGKESRMHDARDETEEAIGHDLRICSAKACRTIWDAKGAPPQPTAPHYFPCERCWEDSKKMVETKADHDPGMRICPKCGQRYDEKMLLVEPD
jgi:transcription elongation factor Elf1